MGEFAWVTLATNDSYSLGALVLAHSLKQVGTKYNLVVLITPGVTKSMRDKLSNVFNLVKEVNILDSKDESNLRLLKRPELGVTFTKLHCWRLTQFDKCVFLDADTLVLKNCDELFERDELSAAPDVGWPDCFNSGVFVYKPSIETYGKLIDFALEKGSFDGGDQGLLNLYFADWATKDINKHLPFIYNMCSTACYSYLPAFKQFGADAKIIHFIGSTKPWLQYFNTETRKVQPSADTVHLGNILQHWWNIFCTLIHPNLTADMSGLAGAFAQLTLGVPRTAEQNALDNQLRRQEWEIGNIDYMGKDSFDNIWTKICETLSTTPSNVVESPTPVAPVQQQDTSISVATKGESTPALQIQAESAPAADSLVQASLPSSQESAKPEQPLSVVEQKVEESKVDTKCQLEKQQGEVKPIETQLQTSPVTSTAPSESAPTAQIVEVAQTKQEQGDAAKQPVQIAEKPVQTAEKPVEKIEEVAKPATVALPEAAPTSPVVEVAQPKPELIQPTEKPVEKTAEVVKPASVASPEPAPASPIVEVAPTKQEQASDAVKAPPTPTTEKPVEKTEEVAKPTIVAAPEAAPTSPIAEVAQTKQEVIKPAEKPVEKSEEVAKPAAIVAAPEAAPTAPVAEVAQTIPEPAGDTAKPPVQATEKPVEKTEDVAKPVNVPQPTGEVVEPKPAAKKEETVQVEGNVTKSEPAKGLPAPESCPVPPKSKSDQDQTPPIAAAEEPKTLSKEEGPKTPSKEEVPQATNVQPTPPPRKGSGGGKKGGKSKK